MKLGHVCTAKVGTGPQVLIDPGSKLNFPASNVQSHAVRDQSRVQTAATALGLFAGAVDNQTSILYAVETLDDLDSAPSSSAASTVTETSTGSSSPTVNCAAP